MQDLLGTIKEEPEVLLRELEAGLHVLTCANGVDRDTKVPCRTLLVLLIRVSGSPI